MNWRAEWLRERDGGGRVEMGSQCTFVVHTWPVPCHTSDYNTDTAHSTSLTACNCSSKVSLHPDSGTILLLFAVRAIHNLIVRPNKLLQHCRRSKNITWYFIQEVTSRRTTKTYIPSTCFITQGGKLIFYFIKSISHSIEAFNIFNSRETGLLHGNA